MTGLWNDSDDSSGSDIRLPTFGCFLTVGAGGRSVVRLERAKEGTLGPERRGGRDFSDSQGRFQQQLFGKRELARSRGLAQRNTEARGTTRLR
jgi:hypothetical protein